jgi:hypothetical protein
VGEVEGVVHELVSVVGGGGDHGGVKDADKG